MSPSAYSKDSKRTPVLLRGIGLWQLLAPGAILAVPLVTYAVFLGYPLLSPEFVAVAALLLTSGAVLGLLILLRANLLAPILLSLLIVLAIDLQLGAVGIFLLGQEIGSGPLSPLADRPVLTLLGVFALLSFLIHIADRKAPQIIVAICAAMMLSTLLFGQRLTEIRPALTAQDTPREDSLPAVVYLVLDEHSGLPGLPREYPETAEIAASLAQFYTNNGFRLFENAFSPYSVTQRALPHLLASDPSVGIENVVDAETKKYVLESNRLFALLTEVGYELRISQSDYFNFCESAGSAVTACAVYQRSNLVNIRTTDLDALQRAQVLLITFASRSLTYQTLYQVIMASAAAEAPRTPPRQRFRIGTVPTFGSIPSLRALDEITASLPKSPRGVAYFAHLLIPHRTYLLDESCEVNWPITRWHLGFETLAKDQNTLESRRAGYHAYRDQLACLYRKLDRLIETIDATPALDDAIVVFQGDHGSKLSERLHPPLNDPALTTEERLDLFSTLFAVRAPGISPGVDERPLTLRDILTETMAELWGPCSGDAQGIACDLSSP